MESEIFDYDAEVNDLSVGEIETKLSNVLLNDNPVCLKVFDNYKNSLNKNNINEVTVFNKFQNLTRDFSSGLFKNLFRRNSVKSNANINTQTLTKKELLVQEINKNREKTFMENLNDSFPKISNITEKEIQESKIPYQEESSSSSSINGSVNNNETSKKTGNAYIISDIRNSIIKSIDNKIINSQENLATQKNVLTITKNVDIVQKNLKHFEQKKSFNKKMSMETEKGRHEHFRYQPFTSNKYLTNNKYVNSYRAESTKANVHGYCKNNIENVDDKIQGKRSSFKRHQSSGFEKRINTQTFENQKNKDLSNDNTVSNKISMKNKCEEIFCDCCKNIRISYSEPNSPKNKENFENSLREVAPQPKEPLKINFTKKKKTQSDKQIFIQGLKVDTSLVEVSNKLNQRSKSEHNISIISPTYISNEHYINTLNLYDINFEKKSLYDLVSCIEQYHQIKLRKMTDLKLAKLWSFGSICNDLEFNKEKKDYSQTINTMQFFFAFPSERSGANNVKKFSIKKKSSFFRKLQDLALQKRDLSDKLKESNSKGSIQQKSSQQENKQKDFNENIKVSQLTNSNKKENKNLVLPEIQDSSVKLKRSSSKFSSQTPKHSKIASINSIQSGEKSREIINSIKQVTIADDYSIFSHNINYLDKRGTELFYDYWNYLQKSGKFLKKQNIESDCKEKNDTVEEKQKSHQSIEESCLMQENKHKEIIETNDKEKNLEKDSEWKQCKKRKINDISLKSEKFLKGKYKVVRKDELTEEKSEKKGKKELKKSVIINYEKKANDFEKALLSADVMKIKSLVNEIEENRVLLFKQSIIQLKEVLLNCPKQFHMTFNLNFFSFVSWTKYLFPSDKLHIARDHDKLILKFSLISVKGFNTKKRPTTILIDCATGAESACIVRHKKKTFTKMPFQMDEHQKTTLSYDLARSAVASFQIQQRINSVEEKLIKEDAKKKTKTVEFQVNASKDEVYKKAKCNNKIESVNVTRKEIKNIDKMVYVTFKEDYFLNMKLFSPIIKLMFMELPYFNALWQLIGGISYSHLNYGFPVNIEVPINNFFRVKQSLKETKFNLKNIEDSDFTVPDNYHQETSKVLQKVMNQPQMRKSYVSFQFKNLIKTN